MGVHQRRRLNKWSRRSSEYPRSRLRSSSMPSPSPEYIWQDRDIKFDANPTLLSCRKGEVIIDSINSVEDTKGNNGERGSLIVTNLRIIWVSHQNPNVNLSTMF